MLRTTPITHTKPPGSGNEFGRKWSDVNPARPSQGAPLGGSLPSRPDSPGMRVLIVAVLVCLIKPCGANLPSAPRPAPPPPSALPAPASAVSVAKTCRCAPYYGNTYA